MGFKVGEAYWIIPGYAGQYLICIKCKIEEIQKLSDDSFEFYWLNEPLGHSVYREELYTDIKLAASELLKRYNEEKEFNNKRADIFLYRAEAIRHIFNTIPKESDNWIAPSYPDKEHLKEWFNVEDIINGRIK